MRYGSVCSGIEAASVAWKPLGWTPEFVSEIEPFPCHVLHERHQVSRPAFMPDPDAEIAGSRADIDKARRARAAAIRNVSGLPDPGGNHVPNYGDLSRFQDWNDHAIDLLVGGTPCQSFSVAGLRKGMADPRGNLALTYLGCLHRYRPRWCVWENVPGVLSSNGGRDFGSFLGAMGQLGYGFAYRVLDAQFVRTRVFPWAVPQRRRRVFVVGYLGDWRRAAAVLFDGDCLSGAAAPRRETGKSAAPTLSARTQGGGGLGTDFDLDGGVIAADMTAIGEYGDGSTASTVKARDYKDATDLVAHTLRGEGFDASEDGTGRGTPIIPVAGAICRDSFSGGAGGRPEGAAVGHFVPVATFPAEMSGTQYASSGDVSPSLSVSHGAAVAFDLRGRDGGAQFEGPHQTANIRASEGGSSRSYIADALSAIPWAVRRLTPRECERLQGFPDDYTQIEWRGKAAADCPDGPRYKSLGNSMATNVMEWIGQRIALIEGMEI